MSFRACASFVLVVSSAAIFLGACADKVTSEEPANGPPVLVDQQVTTEEDTPVEIPLLKRASDPEGDVLTVFDVKVSGSDTEPRGDGAIVVTPPQDYHGTIGVTFKVSDGISTVNGQATVTVRPVNDAPIAIAATKDVRRNTVVALEGRDVEGDAFTYEIVTGPEHGTLTGTPPLLVYSPAVDFAGQDSLTFRVLDATLASAPVVIQLQVSADAVPVARAETVSVDEDVPRGFTLAASDEEGDPVTFTVVTPPEHGTLTGTAPNLTYVPAENFSGSDSMTFTASDGFRSSDAAEITIDVKPVNDPPTATPQTVAATEDTGVSITLAGTDIDGDALTFQIERFPSRGVLSGSGAARTYTPNPNVNGQDSFRFIVSDAAGNSAPATVTIDVAPVNDPPVAGSFSEFLDEDTALTVQLTSTDIDDFSASYAIVTPPQHGTLTDGTGTFRTYRPAANFNGTDSFTYTASDDDAISAPATVTLTVFPVNDPPVAISSSVSTVEDTSVAITLQASDPDGDFLFSTVTQAPSDGVLSGTAPNLTYTPAPNANGSRSLRFTVFAGGESRSATVSIAIAPVNDPPTIIDDYLEAEAGEPLVFRITTNDFDVEGDSLELASLGEPEHGTLEIDGDDLVYTPAGDFSGVDVFSYEVEDAHGATSIGSIHIGVGEFPTGAPTEAIATVGADTDIVDPALSGNGRYIAFNSDLALVPEDANGVHDIYVYDRGRRTLARVSVATGGGESNSGSIGPGISGDGRYVVFFSSASNLVSGDTNGRSDVFRHDRVTGETVRISVATGGGQASGHSAFPDLSDDGNVVAFRSSAFDLVANDANGVDDIFVRDIAAGTTTRVSVSITGGDADLPSNNAELSADGRHVVFSSAATNLVPGDGNNVADTFVRDLAVGTTIRASVSTTGGEADAACSVPSISRDGRFVSFVSTATNLVTGSPAGVAQLYVRDLQAQTTLRPLSSSSTVRLGRLSGDGRYVTIQRSSGVVIHDRFAAVTLTPAGASGWRSPAISDNGRYVAVIDLATRKVFVTPNTL